ncbi:MAG: hypothetical protein ACRC28_00915 [Clostridium sp.]|uniref:hypothetical protein n=1 Tax=Clostridia TaxID=186801 RepID=UPI003F37741F
MMEVRYYPIKSVDMAKMIRNLTGQEYRTKKDRDSDKLIYMFRKTPEFSETLFKLSELKRLSRNK